MRFWVALAQAQAEADVIPTASAEAIGAALAAPPPAPEVLAARSRADGVVVPGLVEVLHTRLPEAARAHSPPRGDQPGRRGLRADASPAGRARRARRPARRPDERPRRPRRPIWRPAPDRRDAPAQRATHHGPRSNQRSGAWGSSTPPAAAGRRGTRCRSSSAGPSARSGRWASTDPPCGPGWRGGWGSPTRGGAGTPRGDRSSTRGKRSRPRRGRRASWGSTPGSWRWTRWGPSGSPAAPPPPCPTRSTLWTPSSSSRSPAMPPRSWARFAGAGLHELERSGAGWTAEWLALPPLVACAGGALAAAERLLASTREIAPPDRP